MLSLSWSTRGALALSCGPFLAAIVMSSPLPSSCAPLVSTRAWAPSSIGSWWPGPRFQRWAIQYCVMEVGDIMHRKQPMENMTTTQGRTKLILTHLCTWGFFNATQKWSIKILWKSSDECIELVQICWHSSRSAVNFLHQNHYHRISLYGIFWLLILFPNMISNFLHQSK